MNADGPSERNKSKESPAKPMENRNAATAIAGHSPAMLLMTASPTESKAKPVIAYPNPDRSAAVNAHPFP